MSAVFVLKICNC